MQEINTATITFHAPTNAGAFFQAYALQNAIRSLGYGNTIINFRSVYQKQQYKMYKAPVSIRTIIQDLYVLKHHRSFSIRDKRFSQMREKHLDQTKECDELGSVQKTAMEHSVLICGSDQIWNRDLPDASDIYYLPGLYNKISYGASFGKQCSSKSLDELGKHIEEFSAISLREKSGIKAVEHTFGKKAEQVLDPTFLLDKEEWNLISDSNKRLDKEYIFFYSINYPEQALRVVEAISRRFKLPVISPFGGFHAFAGRRAERHGIEVDYSAGPKEFLDYIKNASLALSDSYHGTVFPIIYQIPFFQIRLLDANNHYIPDERIDCLLEQLTLTDRIVSYQSIEKVRMDNDINWLDTNDRIAQLRKKSLIWLEKSIQEVVADHFLQEEC